MGQGKLRVVLLVAVALSSWPAAAQGATATVRAFNAAPGLGLRLQIDGKPKGPVLATGSYTAPVVVTAKRHVFRALDANGHAVATAKLRIAAGRHAILGFAQSGHGLAVVLANEPIARGGIASFRVIDLAAALGPVNIALGDEPLRVVRGLGFGHTSRTIAVSPAAAPLGHVAVHALRVADGSDRGQADVLIATGNALAYVLFATGSGTALVQMPWTASGPNPLAPPAITGTRKYAHSITCYGGTWTGNPDIKRVWTLDGKTIAGPVNSTLPLAQGTHDGHAIGCRVTATLGHQSVTVRVPAFWLPKAPTATGQPAITGTPVAGQNLTCGQGGWLDDLSTLTFSYAWFRDGVQIGTGASHTLVAADNLKLLTCSVTAANDGGATTRVSLEGVTLGAPVPTSPPTVTGTAAVGQQLTRGAAGTWDYHGAPITLAYEWLRCSSPTACNNIGGATNTTYTVTAADIGFRLILEETASDPGDPTLAQTQQSSSTAVVPALLAVQATTAVTNTTATLHGTVTANGVATTVHFALTCALPCVGSSTDDQSIPAGSGPDPITLPAVAVSGLDPNTAYGVRLIETAPGSATVTTGGNFTTDPDPPVTTVDATTVTGQTTATLHGHIDTSGVTATAHFEYATDAGFTQNLVVRPNLPTVAVGSATAVSDGVTGLQANTTYYVRLLASNAGGSDATPGTGSFTTPADVPVPVVDATDGIARTAATLHGHVDTNGVAATAHFEYWPDSNTSDITSTTPQPVPAGSNQAVSEDIGGLTANTAYTVKLVVLNNGGTGEDTGGGFTTNPLAPIATIGGTTGIGSSAATLHGSVNTEGVDVTVHFEYSVNADFSGGSRTGDATIHPGGAIPATPISSLAPNTLYYVQLVAQNSFGDVDTSANSFTTLPLPPAITATTLNDISAGMVTLRGKVNPEGDATTTYQFAWGIDPDVSQLLPSAMVVGTGDVDVTSALSGLDPSTVYDYQLSATNSGGTSQGALLKFRSAAELNGSTVTINRSASLLTCNRGTWTDDANNTYGYVWIRDGSPIGGETSSTYTLSTADLGHTVNCVVTATNTYGGITGGSTVHAASNGLLLTSPFNTAAPVATAGATSATVDPGTWLGSGAITYTFAWSVCPDTTGNGCSVAPGTTNPTTGEYTYDPGDVSGTYLKATVTATDSVGPVSADSNVIQVP